MAMPLYDVAIRTSVVTSAAALCQLLPPALALGTGRMLRIREVCISNTTATAFGVGIGVASGAGTTPGTAQTIVRRSNGVGAIDAASVATAFSTFATTPVVPTGYHKRLWIPASSLVIYSFPEGEELLIPPAATPLPFCVWNTGTGQVADISLSWSE